MSVSFLPPTRAQVETALREQYVAARREMEDRCGPITHLAFTPPMMEWNRPHGDRYYHVLSWYVTRYALDPPDPVLPNEPQKHALGIDTEHPL